MAKKKKPPKADTTAGQVQAFQDADLEPLDPPEHVYLPDSARPFWDDIIDSRARATWTRADLVQAAELARTQADIQRLREELDEEDDLKPNSQGTFVSPKHQLVETLVKRAINLARALHVHAAATQGRSRDTGAKTKREKQAQAAKRASAADPLIASPIDSGDRLH